MRANKFFTGLFSLTLCTLALISCQQKDLVFDHEKTQFEPISNAVLIELIAPVGTAVDDEIYIFGAFNGLDETTAPGAIQYQMEKAPDTDNKWGILFCQQESRRRKGYQGQAGGTYAGCQIRVGL